MRIETVEPKEQWMTWEEAPNNVPLVRKGFNAGHMYIKVYDKPIYWGCHVGWSCSERVDGGLYRFARPDEVPDMKQFCKEPEEEEYRPLSECPEGVLLENKGGCLFVRKDEYKVFQFHKESGMPLRWFQISFWDLLVRPCRTKRIVIDGGG